MWSDFNKLLLVVHLSSLYASKRYALDVCWPMPSRQYGPRGQAGRPGYRCPFCHREPRRPRAGGPDRPGRSLGCNRTGRSGRCFRRILSREIHRPFGGTRTGCLCRRCAYLKDAKKHGKKGQYALVGPDAAIPVKTVGLADVPSLPIILRSFLLLSTRSTERPPQER